MKFPNFQLSIFRHTELTLIIQSTSPIFFLLSTAVKGNENKAIMDDSSMRERFGTIGNQFALTSILAFLMSIPLMLATEGHKLSQFYGLWKTNPVVSFNLIVSFREIDSSV